VVAGVELLARHAAVEPHLLLCLGCLRTGEDPARGMPRSVNPT
jgi:hypothetical protein